MNAPTLEEMRELRHAQSDSGKLFVGIPRTDEELADEEWLADQERLRNDG